MTNDCLRFKPTIATTCYGMNDHEYRRYEDRIGQAYRQYSQAIVEAFKTNGVRVIQGSPGCVGKNPRWSGHTNATQEDLNLNLCNLRNIGLELTAKEKIGFADVFWPMLTAGAAAQRKYGTSYAIAGHDGVHPGWAGHTVMAYAFLKAFGLNGKIGALVVDLRKNKMMTSPGHELLRARDADGRELLPGKDGVFKIRSSRYPFCACVPAGQAAASYPVCGADDPAKDDSIRSAMTLVPFNPELNRLTLVAKNGKGRNYKVTWGDDSKIYSADQLAHGINLVDEFPRNPFCEAFARVDAAVAAKQAFETKQIKQMFRSPEAKADLERVVAQTETEREPLALAIKTAFVPVEHTIKIEPQ
jgi:hypothetical protein